MERIPSDVLSDAMAEAIAGRRVRTALFTTYSFDPAFFELNVLPLLFDRAFSQAEAVTVVQLEDALRDLDEVAVVYDRAALAQDAHPARLDVRRVDVRCPTGAFHPKVVLLLVDEPEDPNTGEVHQALVVGVLSANLTRAGWWENVEAAHFDEIKDRERGEHPKYRREPFRRDVLALLRRIESVLPAGDELPALERVRTFLRTRTVRRTPERASSAKGWWSRIWTGQESLPEFLASLNLDRWSFNLEVVSPYFDAHDHGVLQRVIDATQPAAVRVFLPTDAEGTALISPEQFNAVAAVATWSKLPHQLVSRGEGGASMADRRVHAKVYRFWARDVGDVVVVGSPNLTRPGHQGRGGNVEAAFFVDASEGGNPRRWWLEPLDVEPVDFEEREAEDAEAPTPIDLTLSFDWSRTQLRWRIDGTATGALDLTAPNGDSLGTLPSRTVETWHTADADLTEAVEELLGRTSFVTVRHGTQSWRVLVREQGMSHKASLLRHLTPEEILRYWSLLSPEQRAAMIERIPLGGMLEGLPVGPQRSLAASESIFDRFAGLFHAFGRLRAGIETALYEERAHEAETLLLGAKFDSLPTYLDQVATHDDGDPVLRYVAFLCARQLVDVVRTDWPDFIGSRGESVAALEERLEQLGELRTELGIDDEDFLAWYEEQFVAWAKMAPEAEGDDVVEADA